ncbi:hypothetical protein FHG87_000416 [Trinorchestia longiramus]|nr:hypothetical protein FHG87_000416 [Trinorchestia longiramus]
MQKSAKSNHSCDDAGLAVTITSETEGAAAATPCFGLRAKRQSQVADTSTCRLLSHAFTPLRLTLRPFLGTRPSTSSLQGGRSLGQDLHEAPCLPSLPLRDTQSISTDVWPPYHGTLRHSLWNIFPSGECRERDPRSPLVFHRAGGEPSRRIKGVTGVVRGVGGTGSTEAMITDNGNRSRLLQYPNNQEQLARRWSAFEMSKPQAARNKDVICPPVSFLSAGERFIAQERYLDVQSNNLGAACDYLTNLQDSSSYDLRSGDNSVESSGTFRQKNIHLSQTRASQIQQKMTINSLLSLKTNHLFSDAKCEGCGSYYPRTRQKSHECLRVMEHRIVECKIKSDATVSVVKNSNDNDTSATSPSSSSPETQVEVYKAPTSQSGPVPTQPRATNTSVKNKITAVSCENVEIRSLDSEIRSSTSDSSALPAGCLSTLTRHDTRAPKQMVSYGVQSVSSFESDAEHQDSGCVLSNVPRENHEVVKSNFRIPEQAEVEAVSLPPEPYSSSEGGDDEHKFAEGVSSAHREVHASLSSREQEEYFVLCFDVKKFDPFSDFGS